MMAKLATIAKRELLRDPKYLEAYLQERSRYGPEALRVALRDAVASQEGGVAGFCRRAGLARTGLYKALSAKGNPSYDTIYRVLDALGMSAAIAQRAPEAGNRQEVKQTDPPNGLAGKTAVKAPSLPVKKSQQPPPKPRILPGSGKGLFVMADDFDAPLPEFYEHM